MIRFGVCVVLVIVGSVSGYAFNRKNIDLHPNVPSGTLLKENLHNTKHREKRDSETFDDIAATQEDVNDATFYDYELATAADTATTEDYDKEYVKPKRRKFEDQFRELYGSSSWLPAVTEPSLDQEDYEEMDTGTVEPPSITIAPDVLKKVFSDVPIVQKDDLLRSGILLTENSTGQAMEPEGNSTYNTTTGWFIADERFHGRILIERNFPVDKNVVISPPKTSGVHGPNEIPVQHNIILLTVNDREKNPETQTYNKAWKRDASRFLVLLLVCFYVM